MFQYCNNDNGHSENPLDYVTIQDLIELGLTPEEIAESYQPSAGGVFHARGAESQGKTLWIAHFYRYRVDNHLTSTEHKAVGNMTFKGKYAENYEVLKSDDLRQYLWDMIHKPYQGRDVIIDEADSEFPARAFTDKEQTEIALRLWHTAKLHNYILMSSHLGNSTDLIMHLAAHYLIYPRQPSFKTNSMDFTVANALDLTIRDWTAYDIIKTMLIYSRRELTEKTETEQAKIRPSLAKDQKSKKDITIDNIDFDVEWQEASFL